MEQNSPDNEEEVDRLEPQRGVDLVGGHLDIPGPRRVGVPSPAQNLVAWSERNTTACELALREERRPGERHSRKGRRAHGIERQARTAHLPEHHGRGPRETGQGHGACLRLSLFYELGLKTSTRIYGQGPQCIRQGNLLL